DHFRTTDHPGGHLQLHHAGLHLPELPLRAQPGQAEEVTMLDPGAFAAAAITLHAAHLTADYWLQTEHQAITKGAPGWRGRVACASHVAVLTATQAVFLLVADRLFGLDLSAGWVAAGLTLNAVTHWWADRRWTLRWLADLLDRTRLVRGKGV